MTTSSTNYTGLYSGNVSGAVPNTAYGNANVVSLLAASTDGANTVGNISATGNVTGGNLLTPGVVSATGNITTAGYFLGTFAGNISGNLTVPGSNTQVLYNNNGNAGASAGFTFDSASNVATVAGNIQGGNVTATGNVTGTYFIGNGSQLTGIVSSTYGNAQVAAYLSSGTVTSNIITTANITGGYILGNGSQLTGLPANYGNSNVTTLLAAFGSNTISTTGNVDSGNVNAANLYSSGVVSAAGNVRGSNINTTGQMSATGNITGNYILGNGSQLTGIAGTYSNADVTSLLASFGSNTISTTGNVTAGYVIGNGSALTNLTGGNVTGSVAQANTANTANAVAGANVSGQVANALVAGTVYTAAQPNITSVGTLTSLTSSGNVTGGNLLTGGAVSATGNVSGNYILGNGSQLTGIATSTYSDANVATFLAAFGSNSISTTGNVTAGNFAGNGSALSAITGANVSGTVANATYATSAGTATSATTAGTVTTAAQPNITSVGTLTSLTSSGNITASYFLGNGSQLTGINTSVTVPGSNTNVIFNDAGALGATAGFTFNKTSNALATTGTISAAGNINSSGDGNFSRIFTAANADIGGNLLVSGAIDALGSVVRAADFSASGNVSVQQNVLTSGYITTQSYISAVGNISGNYFVGNGSLLTGVQSNATTSIANGTSNVRIANANGNVTVAVGGVTRATFASTDTTIVGNVTLGYDASVGNNLSTVTANVINGLYVGVGGGTGIISAAGNITTTANISGAYFIGNGSALNGVLASPAGPNLSLQFNQAGSTQGDANIAFNYTTGVLSLAGLTIASTFSPTNPVNLNTPTAWSGGYSNVNSLVNGQILVGNGYFGSQTPSNAQTAAPRGAKFLIWDSANITEPANASVRYNGLTALVQVSASNVANANSLVRGGVAVVALGGGPSANTWSATGSGPGAVVGFNQAAVIGQPNATVALGNVTLTGTSASYAQVIVNAGSNVGNAVASYAQINNAGNITSMIGMSAQFTGTSPTTTPTNAFGYYMPGTVNSYGYTNSNAQRAATNYYFLRNDDPVAQTQLGTLRSYNEYNYISPTTSGALTIDKVNAQVQQVNLTGNITSITYANLVTSLSDSVNTDEEVDTVTIIFNQGTTGGYGVIFPTGSTYKYANGVSTLQSFAANSVSLVSVTATRISGTTTYLTTISPGFV